VEQAQRPVEFCRKFSCRKTIVLLKEL
jgi:hypothetical protein